VQHRVQISRDKVVLFDKSFSVHFQRSLLTVIYRNFLSALLIRDVVCHILHLIVGCIVPGFVFSGLVCCCMTVVLVVLYTH